MVGIDKECDCIGVSNLQFCGAPHETVSNDVEVVRESSTIQPDDEILIIRGNCHERRVYKASFDHMDASTALLLMNKAVLMMPRTDPADGQSLWNNNGVICVGSEDISNYGQSTNDALIQALSQIQSNLKGC